jgi:hypothetical protein
LGKWNIEFDEGFEWELIVPLRGGLCNDGTTHGELCPANGFDIEGIEPPNRLTGHQGRGNLEEANVIDSAL